MYKRVVASTGPAAADSRQAAAQGEEREAASPWVGVTSAQDIVGREIRDPRGKIAGEVRSLVVDLRRGQVLYALVGSKGALDIGGQAPYKHFSISPQRQQS